MHIFPVDTSRTRTYDFGMLEHLGPKIRKLRKEKGLTLVEIAAKTGIAQATLSRIETGTMIGTVESHAKIAGLLEVPLSELYAESSAVPAAHMPAKRPVHHDKSIHRELLSPEDPQKKISPVMLTLQPGSETQSEQGSRGCEKFVYMLEGATSVLIGNDEYPLKTGETLYFEASAPHRFKNSSEIPARLLTVSSRA